MLATDRLRPSVSTRHDGCCSGSDFTRWPPDSRVPNLAAGQRAHRHHTQQFIDWQPAPADPAGAARVSIDTFQAVKAFVSRCKLSRTPVDMAAAAMINVLTIRFEDLKID